MVKSLRCGISDLRRIACALVLALAGTLPVCAQSDQINGVFLVAKPDMQDPNFRETVVLITQTQPGTGPLGLILNRPLTTRLSDVFPGTNNLSEASNVLFSGGPVQRQRILFLMRNATRPTFSVQILDDVFLGGDRGMLEKIVRGEMQLESFRAYAGFSGWGPRQIQSEIARGGWYVIDADPEIIFSPDTKSMWQEMVKRATTLRTRLDRDTLRVDATL